MKLLHTSDWHLGRSLYGKKRYEEFKSFLSWLENTINSENIDTLIVAGDIFDNSTPGNMAQQLYYNFLFKVSSSACRHIIIIAGNHDSPSFLDAPKALLKSINVYVTGTITDNPDDEVIVLYDSDNNVEAVVCAVPYLRDRDIRTAEAGETFEEKNKKLIKGMENHYRKVCDSALKKINKITDNTDIPLIGTGHLFTAGGRTEDKDGVRDLYVGSLAHFNKDLFPKEFNYIALGHLHVPQTAGGDEYIRYSGSPIPMGYGEAEQQKIVIIADFKGKKVKITEKKIPCFQVLEKIKGSTNEIISRIDVLRFENSSAWLEIEYTGSDAPANLRETLEKAVSDTLMEIRRIKNNNLMQKLIQRSDTKEELDNLSPEDVFIKCLDSFSVPEEEKKELISSHREILNMIYECDSNAD